MALNECLEPNAGPVANKSIAAAPAIVDLLNIVAVPGWFLPAAGQGIIVVESRSSDKEMDEVLGAINHSETAKKLACERAFLERLEGGCQLPCGITTSIEENTMTVAGAVFATEGIQSAEAKYEGSADEPEAVGRKLAELVLENGGREILEKMRR